MNRNEEDLGRAWNFTQDSLAEITDTCEEGDGEAREEPS